MGDGALIKTLLTIKNKWLILICGAMLVVISSASADIALEEFVPPNIDTMNGFDHLATGFPLTGYHDLLECEACHIGGVYEKLPTRCNYCHDNASAQGMSPGHVMVSGPCDICHTTLGFIENLEMDHSAIQGACYACHNGKSLKGKPVDHVRSSELCDACHTTMYWLPIIKVDHTQIFSNCGHCHNGIKVNGKHATHINSSNQCDACHHSSESWQVVVLTHDHVNGNCANCHRFTLKHPNSSNVCEACHNRFDWTQVVHVEHDQVFGNCGDCHDFPVQHPRSTVVCEECHSTSLWSELNVQHSQFVGRCVDCHQGDLPSNHVVPSNECGECHLDQANWLNSIEVDHKTVKAQCSGCHKINSGHMPVTTDCLGCHVVYSFGVIEINHNEITSQICVFCHDGEIATGMPKKHCATNPSCQNCHNTSEWDHARDCK